MPPRLPTRSNDSRVNTPLVSTVIPKEYRQSKYFQYDTRTARKSRK